MTTEIWETEILTFISPVPNCILIYILKLGQQNVIVCLSIEAPEKVRSVGFFKGEKCVETNTATINTNKKILNVGNEVFQDSENTQIHMGTGNISQIPDIYFVNEFFIQKTWELLVKKKEEKKNGRDQGIRSVGRGQTNNLFVLPYLWLMLVLYD